MPLSVQKNSVSKQVTSFKKLLNLLLNPVTASGASLKDRLAVSPINYNDDNELEDLFTSFELPLDSTDLINDLANERVTLGYCLYMEPNFVKKQTLSTVTWHFTAMYLPSSGQQPISKDNAYFFPTNDLFFPDHSATIDIALLQEIYKTDDQYIDKILPELLSTNSDNGKDYPLTVNMTNSLIKSIEPNEDGTRLTQSLNNDLPSMAKLAKFIKSIEPMIIQLIN